MEQEYIKLKDYPFHYIPFNWLICLKVCNGDKQLMLGVKWDVINGIAVFPCKESLLESNVISVSTQFDIVEIITDWQGSSSNL